MWNHDLLKSQAATAWTTLDKIYRLIFYDIEYQARVTVLEDNVLW